MGLFSGLTNSCKIFFNRTESIYIPLIGKYIKLRPRSSDIIVYKQIFVWEEYKFPVRFKPTVIIDGGGNIGLSALYFSAKFPDARVFVLEPDAENFQVLRENTADNPKIIPIETALWGSNISFKTESSAGFWGTQIHEDESGKRALTIPDLMRQFDLEMIDILKLDIEGAEKDLFQSDVAWLERTRMIVIELHDFMMPDCSKIFFSAIKNLNYSLDICGENIVITNLDLQ